MVVDGCGYFLAAWSPYGAWTSYGASISCGAFFTSHATDGSRLRASSAPQERHFDFACMELPEDKHAQLVATFRIRRESDGHSILLLLGFSRQCLLGFDVCQDHVPPQAIPPEYFESMQKTFAPRKPMTAMALQGRLVVVGLSDMVVPRHRNLHVKMSVTIEDELGADGLPSALAAGAVSSSLSPLNVLLELPSARKRAACDHAQSCAEKRAWTASRR